MITIDDSWRFAAGRAREEVANLAVDLQRIETVAPGSIAAIAAMPSDQAGETLTAMHPCKHATDVTLADQPYWHIAYRDAFGQPGRVQVWPMSMP